MPDKELGEPPGPDPGAAGKAPARMLLGIVPSRIQTPPRIAPIAAVGEVAEDPLPTSRSHRGGSAAAGVLLMPLPGAELPLVSLEATISPLHLLLVVAGAGLAAFGALAAASLIGYSPTRLGQFLEDEDRADRDERIAELDRRDAEYQTVAFAIAAAGWLLALSSVQRAIDPANQVWALPVLLVAMVMLAGTLPTTLAQVRPERSLLLVLPVLRTAWYPLRWPLVLPLLGLTRLGVQLLRWKPASTDSAEVQKQVMAAVADSVTGASLADTERTWIGNIVALKDLQVSTVMTPRPDIVAFAETTPLREAVRKALEHGFSRYPVFRDRIDEVVGVFNVKDALGRLQDGGTELDATPLRSLLREPLFAPETMGAAQLLRRFQAANQHMAIVIDEYGTTVGLVTVEDILEEIVGDIGDEYDPPPQANPDAERIRVVESGRVLEFPARTSVADVNRLLGSELPEDGDWETVAGLVISRLNHIPQAGELLVVDGVEFRVLQADQRRVHWLRATLLDPQPTEERR
jgi:CBS domain containing-hemolysin-like protein